MVSTGSTGGGGSTRVPSRDDIVAAHTLIAEHVRRTPCLELDYAAGGGSRTATLKLELLQHTGSFKPRGAFTNVLGRPEPPARLVAASGGNHGVAVAHVGRRLGIPVDVFVPEAAPALKVREIRDRGARVHLGGATYAEAHAASTESAVQPGSMEIHPYDAPATVAGQGTVGLELSEQEPQADTILVAVGGGGLVGGIAAWWSGQARVVTVEPSGCPTMHAALEAGHPVDVAPAGLASDALGASRVGAIGFAAVHAAQGQAVLVEEDAIRAARSTLWRDARVVAEPAGATALAALLSGAYVPGPHERVAVVVCGGNADPADLAEPAPR